MLAINIPADGLFLAIQNKANGDFSESNCARIIGEYIARFLQAEPDVILLNVSYRRALTRSEVIDSYLYDIETDENGFAIKDSQGESVKTLSPVGGDVSKYFLSFFVCARELLRNGIDVFQIAIERIRQTDCQVFLSVRMNDVHYTHNSGVNSSFALKNGGQHTIHKDGAYLDYSQEAVRNYHYAYVEELLGTYQVDGIEADWLRHPNVLPPESCSDYSILTDYMRQIRRLLDSYNKNICLAVRVLPTEAQNLNKGLDVCGWIADGSVDMVTIENFYIPTNYEPPVQRWKNSIESRNAKGHPYRLLCGSDWAVSCVSMYNLAMNPALVRGFADTCLGSGADGVYLFNFLEEDDISSRELKLDENGQAYLADCFLQRIEAAKHPEVLPRRYVHIGNASNRYPISLEPDGFYTFAVTVKSPAESCKVIIGCDRDAELAVCANDCPAEDLQAEPIFPGFEYIPAADVGKENPFIYAVTQAAPVVKSASLPADAWKDGTLAIKIQNTSGDMLKLLWLEITCE